MASPVSSLPVLVCQGNQRSGNYRPIPAPFHLAPLRRGDMLWVAGKASRRPSAELGVDLEPRAPSLAAGRGPFHHTILAKMDAAGERSRAHAVRFFFLADELLPTWAAS